MGDYAFRNRDEISNSRARFSHQTRGCSIQRQFATLETRNSKELEPKYVLQVSWDRNLERAGLKAPVSYLQILSLSLATDSEIFANSFPVPSNSSRSLCES